MHLKRKKAAYILTAILLVLLSCPPAFAGSLAAYNDIEGHWAHQYIATTLERGIFSGMDAAAFAPEVPVTRAMFISILYRMDASGIESNEAGFVDVPAASYYYNAVNWAKGNNIASGTTAETFSPDLEITREQMASLLVRYVEYCSIDLPNVNATDSFSDSDSISDYAKPAVEQCKEMGLLSGVGDNQFNPKGYSTRAQAAVAAAKLLELIEQNEPQEVPEKDYIVSFKSNSGSAVSSQTVREGETAVKPGNPTRTGYSFSGWYSDPDLKDAYDFSVPVISDITLYAKWQRAASSGGGGSGSSGNNSNNGGSGGSDGSSGGEEKEYHQIDISVNLDNSVDIVFLNIDMESFDYQIEDGDSFKFKVTPHNGYILTGVSANSVGLAANEEGIYEIAHIEEDIHIQISVELVANFFSVQFTKESQYYPYYEVDYVQVSHWNNGDEIIIEDDVQIILVEEDLTGGQGGSLKFAVKVDAECIADVTVDNEKIISGSVVSSSLPENITCFDNGGSYYEFYVKNIHDDFEVVVETELKDPVYVEFQYDFEIIALLINGISHQETPSVITAKGQSLSFEVTILDDTYSLDEIVTGYTLDAADGIYILDQVNSDGNVIIKVKESLAGTIKEFFQQINIYFEETEYLFVEEKAGQDNTYALTLNLDKLLSDMTDGEDLSIDDIENLLPALTDFLDELLEGFGEITDAVFDEEMTIRLNNYSLDELDDNLETFIYEILICMAEDQSIQLTFINISGESYSTNVHVGIELVLIESILVDGDLVLVNINTDLLNPAIAEMLLPFLGDYIGIIKIIPNNSLVTILKGIVNLMEVDTLLPGLYDGRFSSLYNSDTDRYEFPVGGSEKIILAINLDYLGIVKILKS